MPLDPRTPIIVAAAQTAGDGETAEPIAEMVAVSSIALDQIPDPSARPIESVRVVRGINPYRNPAALVADRLGLEGAHTAHTQIGGNEAFDLVNLTAEQILAGQLDAALVCSAETMRTRRRDKAAGRRSTYLDEALDAVPDLLIGSAEPFWDDLDVAAEASTAVNFYAMAESAIRHRRGETVAAHRARIAQLWAQGSETAPTNPVAAMPNAIDAETIATVTDRNRMVASPYPKLMTSNINVDQAAAVVVCSVEWAQRAGVPEDRWFFVNAGAKANDHWMIRERWTLDESPAMRASIESALDHNLAATEPDMVDFYSCFPAAVQTAFRELRWREGRRYTITGGMTFAGGPFNSYCMHSLVRAFEWRQMGSPHALLTGNGGFFTKHSALVLTSDPGPKPFEWHRPQEAVDLLPKRPLRAECPTTATIEAYTATYGRYGTRDKAILSILDDDGARHWAHAVDPALIDAIVDEPSIGRTVTIDPTSNVPTVTALPR